MKTKKSDKAKIRQESKEEMETYTEADEGLKASVKV